MNKAWPGVVEALDLIGSTQIQGRCSLAGNLCNASPAADSVPACIAAGAIAVVVGPQGHAARFRSSRSPPAPGRTSLAKGEFILEFKFRCRVRRRVGRRLSALHPAHRDGHRGGRRAASASRWTTRASAPRRASRSARWRRRVLLVTEAADALIGHKLDDATRWRSWTRRRSAACKPIADKRGTIEYRTKVAGVLARRVAAIAFDRAMGKTQGKTH